MTTAGSHGDVHPFLAVGRALRSRGHTVRLLAHPHYRQATERAGVEHEPMLASLDLAALLRDPRLMDARRGGPFVLDMLMDTAPEALRTLEASIHRDRPDVVLRHHITVGAGWVCDRAGVPRVTATLAPAMWLSRFEPVPQPQRRPGRLRALGARTFVRAARPVLPLLVRGRTRRLRAQIGLPRRGGAFVAEWLGAGGPVVGLWSSHLRGPMADDPPASTICGFPWHDGGHAAAGLTPDLEAFLADDDPPVVFSLGTAAVHSAGDFYAIAAESARLIDRRAVLLTGIGCPVPPGLGPSVIAVPYAPFSLLLDRCAATVHHGGIGSTAQAMRAGRPMVTVPHAHDQFHNGLNAHRLGVGAIVRRRGLTPRRMAAALRVVLEDPAYAARAVTLGAHISVEDGGARAADVIEAVGRGEARPVTE